MDEVALGDQLEQVVRNLVITHPGRLLQEIDHVVNCELELVRHGCPESPQILIELFLQIGINLYLWNINGAVCLKLLILIIFN